MRRELKRFAEFLGEQNAQRRAFRNIDEAALTALAADAADAGDEQKRRRPGKAGRITPIEERYEWTVLRLRGLSMKEIAGLYSTGDAERMTTENAVGKAVRRILKAARLDWSALRKQVKKRVVLEITDPIGADEPVRERLADESDEVSYRPGYRPPEWTAATLQAHPVKPVKPSGRHRRPPAKRP